MKSITLSEKDIARFWSKVKIGSPNECWEWQDKLDQKGYGHFQTQKHNPRAHRVSWIIHFGEILKYCVCHKCDNRSCVNPLHLFLGTYDDNNKDRTKKGRSAVGENNRSAKLTEKDVLSIIKMASHGESQRKIAKKFQVSHVAIGSIIRGIAWKHINR